MAIKQIVIYYLLWQAGLTVVNLVAMRALPLRESFLGVGTGTFMTNPLLYSRSNFDGEHYLNIARNGYSYAEQAFFPLYPNIMKFLFRFFRNDAWVGVLISNTAFLLVLVLLAKLIRLDRSVDVVKYSLFSLLLFPTSFYFGSIYTESLFLLLIVGAFYCARRNKWWLAGLLGMFATNTRFIGIFLLPALFVEYWLQYKDVENWRIKLNSFLPLLLVPLGLLSYMFYLNKTVGDPLAFFHMQKLFGQFRSEKIIMLYQVFWRYAKMVISVNRQDPLFFTILLELATGIVFLATSIYSLFKQRISYALFNVCAYLVPTLTGSFVSLPRYVLVCFPTFIILGQFLVDHPRWRKLILTTNGILLATVWSMFARGYWVG